MGCSVLLFFFFCVFWLLSTTVLWFVSVSLLQTAVLPAILMSVVPLLPDREPHSNQPGHIRHAVHDCVDISPHFRQYLPLLCTAQRVWCQEEPFLPPLLVSTHNELVHASIPYCALSSLLSFTLSPSLTNVCRSNQVYHQEKWFIQRKLHYKTAPSGTVNYGKIYLILYS